MKHDQLLAFEAIVTSGTFRGAAEKLNKSQSAISHTIRQLEEELGLTLFSRDQYRPSLTAEGQVLFREASRVLVRMRELRATAERLRAREEPELRLAVTATLPLEHLLPVLAEIGHSFPATHLRLSTEMMGGAIARLMEGRADLAIATLDGVPVDEVETRRLVEVTILPVASRAMADRLGPGGLAISLMQTIPQIVVAGTGGTEDSQSRDLLPGGQEMDRVGFRSQKTGHPRRTGLGWHAHPSGPRRPRQRLTRATGCRRLSPEAIRDFRHTS